MSHGDRTVTLNRINHIFLNLLMKVESLGRERISKRNGCKIWSSPHRLSIIKPSDSSSSLSWASFLLIVYQHSISLKRSDNHFDIPSKRPIKNRKTEELSLGDPESEHERALSSLLACSSGGHSGDNRSYLGTRASELRHFNDRFAEPRDRQSVIIWVGELIKKEIR